jgi:hypothetical protein
MTDLEETLLAVLNEHYKSGSWAPRRNTGMLGRTDRVGHWSCSCGAYGDVAFGESVTALHRRHLARELARRAGGVDVTGVPRRRP